MLLVLRAVKHAAQQVTQWLVHSGSGCYAACCTTANMAASVSWCSMIRNMLHSRACNSTCNLPGVMLSAIEYVGQQCMLPGDFTCSNGQINSGSYDFPLLTCRDVQRVNLMCIHNSSAIHKLPVHCTAANAQNSWTDLLEAFPEVVYERLLLDIVSFFHDSPEACNFLLLYGQVYWAPFIQQLDMIWQTLILWGKEHTTVLECLPLDVFAFLFAILGQHHQQQ